MAASIPLIAVHPRVRGEHCQYAISYVRITVHPRVRGEHLMFDFLPCRLAGSSPRTRGTRSRFQLLIENRFIPAYAGNTAGGSAERIGGSSPRTRGTLDGDWFVASRSGSSPRTRGTLDLQLGQFRANAVHPRVRGEHCIIITDPLGSRFIPAYAGNTPICSRHVAATAGSSPRTRGTLAG